MSEAGLLQKVCQSEKYIQSHKMSFSCFHGLCQCKFVQGFCSLWLSTAFHFTVSFRLPQYCLSCTHKVTHLPIQVTWQLLVPHSIKNMLHIHMNILGPLLRQFNKRWPWGLDLFEPNSEPIETKLNFTAPGRKNKFFVLSC